jgi:hypothetical protein
MISLNEFSSLIFLSVSGCFLYKVWRDFFYIMRTNVSLQRAKHAENQYRQSFSL